jgi:hypothetical protein
MEERQMLSVGIISLLQSVEALSALLRRTLHALRSWWHAILVLIILPETRSPLSTRMTSCVHIFQIVVVVHAVGRGAGPLRAWRKYLFQKLEVLHLRFLGELDVELNVQVAWFLLAM